MTILFIQYAGFALLLPSIKQVYSTSHETARIIFNEDSPSLTCSVWGVESSKYVPLVWSV